MKKALITPSLLSLLAISLANTNADADAQSLSEDPIGRPSVSRAGANEAQLPSDHIRNLDRQLVLLEGEALNTPGVAARAANMALRYNQLGQTDRAERAFKRGVEAANMTNDLSMLSYIYDQWANVVGARDFVRGEQLEQWMLQALQHESIASPIKQRAYEHMIAFYHRFKRDSQATAVQSEYASLMSAQPPQPQLIRQTLPFRCPACGRG